jgi:hypothetical protein
LINLATQRDWHNDVDVLIEAGRLLLRGSTESSIHNDIQFIIEKIPPLRTEAWEKLVEIESSNDNKWDIPQLLQALRRFRGQEAKQKAFWLLEQRPAVAAELVTHEDEEIAIQAAQIILTQKTFDSRAMGKLICWGKSQGTDIPQRAIERTFANAGNHDMHAVEAIILSTFSTEADKERAADLLLLENPDILCLGMIKSEVPSRSEEVRLREDVLIEAREAAKTPTERLIERIYQLEDAQKSQ